MVLYQGMNLFIILIIIGMPVGITLLLLRRYRGQTTEEDRVMEKIKELEERIHQLENRI